MDKMLEAKQRIGWYMNVWTHEYVVYLRIIDGLDVDTFVILDCENKDRSCTLCL